jgi:hypothetical protein
VQKCCKDEQATDDGKANAHYMPDTQGCRHTHRMCNTYCLFTATMAAQKRLNVTLYLILPIMFKVKPDDTEVTAWFGPKRDEVTGE